jgi:biopolymer transport protein ExbB/TolQ
MLVPVIILLIFFFLRALLLLGGFFGQYLVKRKSGAEIREQMNTLTLDNIDTLGDRLPKNKQAVIVSYMKKLVDNRQSKAQVNRILDQYAQFVEKDLSLPSTLLKMGPMLGLMGTLIPMGPALVGLSTGDIASMAYNMQVAFATTVVGLFSAAIGFVTKQTKNRWYTEDMSNLELIPLEKASVTSPTTPRILISASNERYIKTPGTIGMTEGIVST